MIRFKVQTRTEELDFYKLYSVVFRGWTFLSIFLFSWLHTMWWYNFKPNIILKTKMIFFTSPFCVGTVGKEIQAHVPDLRVLKVQWICFQRWLFAFLKGWYGGDLDKFEIKCLLINKMKGNLFRVYIFFLRSIWSVWKLNETVE